MVLHSIRLAVLITLCTFNSLQANSDTEQWFKKSTITLTDLSEVPGMVLEGTLIQSEEEHSLPKPNRVVPPFNPERVPTLPKRSR